MFNVDTNEKPNYNERLINLFSRCKLVLSDDTYMKKLENYFTSNNESSIDTNSIDKYNYSLVELKNFLQAMFIGISHFCSENENRYGLMCTLVDCSDDLYTWYDINYNGKVYRFTEYDGDEVFGYQCSVAINSDVNKQINIEDIINYYQNFDPEKPHEKVRSKK